MCLDVFGCVWTCLDVFGCVMMCLDVFGCVWTCLGCVWDVFGCVWMCLGTGDAMTDYQEIRLQDVVPGSGSCASRKSRVASPDGGKCNGKAVSSTESLPEVLAPH